MKPAQPSFGEALRFWHALGWISFGGPAGQIAIMHTELVERRAWTDEATFLRGLNFCMLLPGPEAMQLATWLGWRLHGLRGGFAAGILFVLPAAMILALLSWAYLAHGQIPAVAGALFGVQAAVLGILGHALQRLATRVLKSPLAIALAVLSLLALLLFDAPFPLLLAGAALTGVAMHRIAPQALISPVRSAVAGLVEARSVPSIARTLGLALLLVLAWWLPLLGLGLWLGPESTSFRQGLFFSQAALVTFGGAYAVLPYVAQHAVEVQGWLSAEQMLIGLGLAESTPGPLIMVLEFVGFVGGWQHPDLHSPLASAVLGAAVTLWATFLPSFLFVLPAAPWIESLRDRPRLDAALAAITAAVVGVIANLALWFGWHLLAPRSAVQIALVLTIALLSWIGLARLRWHVAWIVLGAALSGAVLQGGA